MSLSSIHQMAPDIMNTPRTFEAGDPPWPVFDIERSLRRLGGDKSLLRDLARFFVEDAESLLTSLQGALESKDTKAASRAAHSLSGQSANFSADICSSLAKAIELASQSGDFESSTGMLEELLREVNRLTEALRRQVLTETP